MSGQPALLHDGVADVHGLASSDVEIYRRQWAEITATINRETRQRRSPHEHDLIHAPARPPSLAEVMRRRRPPRNINKEAAEKLTPLDRLALWITLRVGSMGFFLIVFAWTAIWLSWNMLAPERLQFDPPMAFVFWLFISNVIQILLMPLIMVGQNVQGTHSELRAEHDLEVNVKAEEEIEVILRHLEYQNTMLIAMLSKLGVNVAEAIHANKE